MPPRPTPVAGAVSMRQIAGAIDADWYRARYPDSAGLAPLDHFIRFGAAQNRDPNQFFDSAWYAGHNPDVAAAGLIPLVHYIQSGAAELRDPHPRFDARYYVGQHPRAAANPLLYHLQTGRTLGYLTERPVAIRDYLPSAGTGPVMPDGVVADVVIVVQGGLDATQRCVRTLLAERGAPLGRIVVVDDRTREPALRAWLRTLAADGHIDLIRNPERLGFAASAGRGIEAAGDRDVVLLDSVMEPPPGWLSRLSAHAWSQPDIASVSPLTGPVAVAPGEPPAGIDALCRSVNAGRSVETPDIYGACAYIRRAALQATGAFCPDTAEQGNFWQRSAAAGWRHVIACDIFVPGPTGPAAEATVAFRFAVTAASFRRSRLPVILMVSHALGGGVRRHIDLLTERCRGSAHILLLQGTERGAALFLASAPDQPVVTLPPDRLNDLIAVLRSAAVSRIHVHHLMDTGIDVRLLISRLGVPFDVTIHDYYALCPQINLLPWPDGLYCGEPGPAGCNRCIANRGSHGARDIVSWRRGHNWLFLQADRVICPALDVKKRLDRYGVGDRAIVVPHEDQTGSAWPIRRPPLAGPLLRIGLLGVLADHKGARTVADFATAAEPGTVDLHLIGHLEHNFPKPAVRFIEITGVYQDRYLPAILQRIDPHVLWFPASWPETYSFTLSAAIASGLPIAAADIGSFQERLAGRPMTWLVDHRSGPKAWMAVFDEVRVALRNRTPDKAVGRPAGVSGFYPGRYMAPAEPVRPPRGKPPIAIVPERDANGGLTADAYIRLLQPLDHAAHSNRFDIVLANSETVFGSGAAIVVTHGHAIASVELANRLAGHCRASGARLVYDLDEDETGLLTTHPDTVPRRTLTAAVRRMLTVADAVWVATPALAERIAPIRPDAIAIGSRLDERLWTVPPAPRKAPGDPVRILCMGAPTQDRDFALIEPVLLRLKAAYGGRIEIGVLGMTSGMDLPAGLSRVLPSAHAFRSHPGLADWSISALPGWDIGLAPLADTPSNRTRSPIQAILYAALGLTVLASDVHAYRGSIADGSAGQLVPNDRNAWYAALDWLIRDPALRRRRSDAAHRAFLAGGTLASQAAQRQAALGLVWP